MSLFAHKKTLQYTFSQLNGQNCPNQLYKLPEMPVDAIKTNVQYFQAELSTLPKDLSMMMAMMRLLKMTPLKTLTRLTSKWPPDVLLPASEATVTVMLAQRGAVTVTVTLSSSSSILQPSVSSALSAWCSLALCRSAPE